MLLLVAATSPRSLPVVTCSLRNGDKGGAMWLKEEDDEWDDDDDDDDFDDDDDDDDDEADDEEWSTDE